MQTDTLKISALLTILVLVFLTLLSEKNYNDAIFYAIHSDGSDIGIEKEMLKFGFDIDANEPNEPNRITKIIALFN